MISWSRGIWITVWIKDIVKKITKKHETNDPFDIASGENIIVCERDMHDEIMGFYKYIRRNKFIFINSNLKNDLKLFTCAHELGHSQLHPRTNTPFLRSNTLFSINKIEREANRFAVELLMPDSYFLDSKGCDLTIYDAASIYGVPKDMCHLKNFNHLLVN